MSVDVTLFEVGPRDGLQNEPNFIPTDRKARLVEALAECGFSKIEVTSFVSPKWVPQLADAADVMAAIRRKEGIGYTALTPNLRAFDAALAARADEVAVFTSASEGFSGKNINCTIDDSFERFRPVLDAAKDNAVPVRGYVSCITDCPFDGAVEPDAVALVAERLLDLGCYEVSLGDTLGVATPDRVEPLLDRLLQFAPPSAFAGHFHDTNGCALANIELCLARGLRVFDVAIGGLGGCPYAPGAQGNVATEAVVQRLEDQGYRTGIDRQKLDAAARLAREMRSAA